MPFCGSGTVTAVGRELRIHEVASGTEVVWANDRHFIREVRTPLVAIVWSDAQGFFQAALPAGVYSAFTVEDSVLYWRFVNDKDHLDSFQVQDGKTTEFHFDIRYEAYD